MTQNISFEFVASNFIGNENNSFSNDLTKLKYPDFTYINQYDYNLKEHNGNISFILRFKRVNNSNHYYFVDDYSRQYEIVKLTYLVSNNLKILTQEFRYDQFHNIVFSISKQTNNNILCSISTSTTIPVNITDPIIIKYVGKYFHFQMNSTTVDTKNCLERKKSSYNDTYISVITRQLWYITFPNGGSSQQWNNLVETVKYLGCHLLQNVNGSDVTEPGRKTLMVVNYNGQYNIPVIFIDVTISSNGTATINNIYINNGQAIFFYPNSNGSIELIGSNYNILRVNKKENCLLNYIMLNSQNDLTVNGDYKDFNIICIGVRKPKEIIYSNNYFPIETTSISYLNENANNGCTIKLRIEVNNVFNGNETPNYYLLEIEFKNKILYGNSCNISTYKCIGNNNFQQVYSVSNIKYEFTSNVSFRLYYSNNNNNDILFWNYNHYNNGSNGDSENTWSCGLLCVKEYRSLAKLLFPPGYVFNGLFGSGNSSTYYTLNGYHAASFFTVFEVSKK